MKLSVPYGNLNLLLTMLVVLLCCMECSTTKTKCRKNSSCTSFDKESCCHAVNRQFGICKPKIQLGKRCHPTFRMVFLSNDGFAFSSCGCANGLTCTKVIKKRKNKRKNKKKGYKIRYKCLPLPKQTRELSEIEIYNS